MNEANRQFLKKMMEAHPDGIPNSQVAQRFRGLVQKLKTCGAVVERPVSRGIKLIVCDLEAFERFTKSMFPRGLGIEPEDIESRAAAVWAYANAKAVQRGSDEGIGVRSAKPDCVITVNGHPISLGQLTELSGGLLIRFSESSLWQFEGTIGIIENIENFWNYEQALPEVDIAIVASPITNKLIDWLKSSGLAGCQLIHWGDYDPVGVREYVRLKRAIPNRTTTFIPNNIEELIAEHGQRERVKKQVVYLNSLRNETDDSIVAKMVSLFDKHRRGLDQELLLHIAHPPKDKVTFG